MIRIAGPLDERLALEEERDLALGALDAVGAVDEVAPADIGREEGTVDSGGVLFDLGDVVLHLLSLERRAYSCASSRDGSPGFVSPNVIGDVLPGRVA